LDKEIIKEVGTMLASINSEAIIEAIEPLCEAMDRAYKAGLTTGKIWAFIEEKLGVRGKGKRVKSIKLPLWMRKALQEEAKKERISQAELMRRALTIYLELKPEEREELIQTVQGRWWKIDYLLEYLEEVEEAYKREMAKVKS
jgi:hypothetical protein